MVTTNCEHPAFSIKEDNLHIIYQEKLNLEDMLKVLAAEYHCERITIQSGGMLNGMFLRKKLFDYVDIIIAPVLVGGKNTATLIDGDSIMRQEELDRLGVLSLEKCEVLEDSYVRIVYKVKKN